MSILGQIEGLAGGQGGNLMNTLSGLVQKSGGIGGLVSTLKQNGLGGVVDSWVGNGANQPVTGEQLGQAIQGTPADQHIEQAAQQQGVDKSTLLQQLAQHLPQVVDHLSPNGQIAQGAGASGLNIGELKGIAAKLGL